MAKDYKNSPKPKDKKPKPTAGWVWMLGGLSIGLSLAVVVYFKDDLLAMNKPSSPASVVDKGQAIPEVVAPKIDTKAKREPEETEHKKPRFDFYNLLPEMEVFLPPREPEARREQNRVKLVTYYLQVGSFQNFADADRLRAQLALTNIESKIQRAVASKGAKVWHRVRVGPFKSARKMDKVRNRLRAQSLDPMVLTVK